MTQPAATSSQAKRHIPQRSCVACRRKAPQGELVRLSKTKAGQWVLGGRGGRGVYLCRSETCWQEKRLRRTFGSQAARVCGLFSPS